MTLSSELVEIILRVVPTAAEVKLYSQYEADGKPLEVLADEDKFLVSVSCHKFCNLKAVCMVSLWFAPAPSVE